MALEKHIEYISRNSQRVYNAQQTIKTKQKHQFENTVLKLKPGLNILKQKTTFTS